MNAPDVFAADGHVLLEPWDGSYHARRALYTFENFPAVLRFDPYLDYPDGAVVPVAPLYDWLLGGVARGFGTRIQTFERVAALSSPVLAGLTVLAVFFLVLSLETPATALLAAALVAVLPIHVEYARLGDSDHHTAVSLLLALWIAVDLRRLVLPGSRFPLRNVLLRGLVLAALILTWSGSALYLLVGEGAALAAAVLFSDRRISAAGQAVSEVMAAVLVVPWLWWQGTPVGGPLSSTTLSGLQPLILISAAGVAVAFLAAERRWPSRRRGERWVRAGVIGSAVAGGLLAVPPLRAALAPGLHFVAGSDVWSLTNPEQEPLFVFLRHLDRGIGPASRYYGWFAYLLPVAPIGLLPALRDRARRGAASLLGIWYLALAPLAVEQIRFGNEFSIPAVAVFAIFAMEAMRFATSRLMGAKWGEVARERVVAVLAVSLAAILMVPAFSRYYAPKVTRLARWLAPASSMPGAREPPPELALVRFLEEVRRVTPETAGFLGPGQPQYGILCPPSLGDSTVYRARRPTPAGNLGPYLDPRRFNTVNHFFGLSSQRVVLQVARHLRVRYVIVTPRMQGDRQQLGSHLERLDGSAYAMLPALGHFRLVTESRETPEPGVAPGRAFKLFEIVPGAVILAQGRPGASVSADLWLVTRTGRRFEFFTSGGVGPGGVARLRVPYATEGPVPGGDVRPVGRYSVRVGGRESGVDVSETDVREGRRVAME